MKERWLYWIILRSSFQWSVFYSPETQSWQEQCICNMSERTGIRDKHSSGVNMSSGGWPFNWWGSCPCRTIAKFGEAVRECTLGLWQKQPIVSLGESKNPGGGENIYWSCSGITDLNLGKRRQCLLFTFTLNQKAKKKVSWCFRTVCATVPISAIVRYVTTWSRGLVPIGQALQANLCHACAGQPGRRGRGDRPHMPCVGGGY